MLVYLILISDARYHEPKKKKNLKFSRIFQVPVTSSQYPPISLRCLGPIQYISSSIFKVYVVSHIFPCPLCSLLPCYFPTKILHIFLMFPAHATYPTDFNLLDMVTLIIGYLVRGANYVARMYSTVGHALCVCACVRPRARVTSYIYKNRCTLSVVPNYTVLYLCR